MPKTNLDKPRKIPVKLRPDELLYTKMSLLKRKPKLKPVRSLRHNLIRKLNRAARKPNKNTQTL
jgi:hypothetical protein